MSEDRKLVTIERILDIQPIEGADRIELVKVRGWQCVAKKGEFQVGDRCVYFEIDSYLPADRFSEEEYGFIGTPRPHDDGTRGYVLKSRKFKGQYSQGLALPVDQVFADEMAWADDGTDVTKALGVKVYEPPVKAELRGLVRGTRPGWISKTDEERLQNQLWCLEAWAGENMVATQKLDGSSMTVYADRINDTIGVTSRNQDLKEAADSAFWKIAWKQELFYLLPAGERVYIQGELFGEGVQGNPLKVPLQFRAFNLVVDGQIIPRAEWPVELLEISVPVYDLSWPKTLEEALAQADTVSTQIGGGRVEGIVWRDRQHTFDQKGNRASVKVISQKYLEKHDK